MREGALLDKIQDLLEQADRDVAKRVVASLAMQYQVAPPASAPRKRGMSGYSDDEEEPEEFSYTSSLGNTETVNMRKHDRECERVLRGR